MGVFKVIKSKSFSRLDSIPGDIPQGCLAVYVGEERRRFVIRAEYLSHPLFKELLKKCEEELGFNYKGGLPMMCDPAFFERVLWLVASGHPDAKSARMEELQSLYPCRPQPEVMKSFRATRPFVAA